MPVFTIALGTDQGMVDVPDETGNLRRIPVPPDELTLQRIAETTGARFFAAPSSDDLKAIYRELGSKIGFVKEKQEITVVFAATGLLFLVAGATMSLTWFSRFPVILSPGSRFGKAPVQVGGAAGGVGEAAVEAVEAVGGALRAWLLGPAEMAADQLEVGPEPVQVAAQGGQGVQHPAGVLLDPQPLEPDPDRDQVGVQGGRRGRGDPPLDRVAPGRVPGGVLAQELVEHRLRGQVAQREVVGALVRADVLVGDGVDVPAGVAGEGPPVQRPGRVALVGRAHAGERLQRELGVDRDHRLPDHQHRVHPGPRPEHVLGPVGAVGQPLGQQLLQQQLPQRPPGLGRAQQVLQAAEPAGLLQDLLGHPGDHRDPLADLRRRVGRPGLGVLDAVEPQVQPPVQVDQAPVEAVGDPGQPPVQLLPPGPAAVADPAPAPEQEPGHAPASSPITTASQLTGRVLPEEGPSWPGRYQPGATYTPAMRYGPPVRFARRRDGHNLAYQVLGDADLDLVFLLGSVRVPTLLLHRTEDPWTDVRASRYMAERVPGARLVELPGVDHLPFFGDQDSVVELTQEFLTGARPPVVEPARVLAQASAGEIRDVDWSRTWSPGPGSPSPTGAATGSRACPAPGSCMPSSWPGASPSVQGGAGQGGRGLRPGHGGGRRDQGGGGAGEGEPGWRRATSGPGCRSRPAWPGGPGRSTRGPGATRPGRRRPASTASDGRPGPGKRLANPARSTWPGPRPASSWSRVSRSCQSRRPSSGRRVPSRPSRPLPTRRRKRSRAGRRRAGRGTRAPARSAGGARPRPR